VGACVAVLFPGVSGADFRLCGCGMMRVLLVLATLSLAAAHPGDILAKSDFRDGTQDWTLAGSGWSSEGLVRDGDMLVAADHPETPNKLWGFEAPSLFMAGDKALAYNGWLSFELGHFEYESMGMNPLSSYDVELICEPQTEWQAVDRKRKKTARLPQRRRKNANLGLKGVFKSADDKLSHSYEVRLEESFQPEGSSASWERQATGTKPSQNDFVHCLQHLKSIRIRGSFFAGAEATWLRNVMITEGDVNKGGYNAADELTGQWPGQASAGAWRGLRGYSDGANPSSFTYQNNARSHEQMTTCTTSGPPGQQHTSCHDNVDIADEGTVFPRPVGSAAGEEYTIKDWDANRVGHTVVSPGGKVTWVDAPDNMLGDHPGDPVTLFRLASQRYPTTSMGGSRSCVSNDKYEIVFDRPGCLTGSHQSCSDADMKSMAARVMEETDLNEGRIVKYDQRLGNPDDHCTSDDGTGERYPCHVMPFRHDYYFHSLPRICSTATLQVAVHGDLKYAGDHLNVYGEDGSKLGTLFAGNLTYEQGDEGHESDTTPYVDSIVISQSHMTQFTADEQMRVTFESHRNKDLGAGVGETDQIGGAAIAGVVGSTDANVGTGDVIQKYKGKVAIRWMKLKFSAAACYVGKVASEDTWEFDVKKHEPQDLNVRVSFRTPKTAQGGAAGGHGALTVVSEGDFSSRHAYLSAVGEDGTVLGRLFHDEEWVSRSANRRPLSEEQTAFDSLAFEHGASRFTDTILLPRNVLDAYSSDGNVTFYLRSSRPENIAVKAKLSPVTLSFPLYQCFMKTIKTGSYLNTEVVRPFSLYFDEGGFAEAAGDVTFFIATYWQLHSRYRVSDADIAAGVRNVDASTTNMRADSVYSEAPAGGVSYVDENGEVQETGTSADVNRWTLQQREEHREWPHGYNYMQLRADKDGELLGNLFLKDYTQYDWTNYFVDTVTIPKDRFNRYLLKRPNDVSGEFSWTLKVPPGSGSVIIRSISISYPVKSEDATTYDDSPSDTLRRHSWGTAPHKENVHTKCRDLPGAVYQKNGQTVDTCGTLDQRDPGVQGVEGPW